MKKITLICMLLTGIYSSTSEARVCFLADPDCKESIEAIINYDCSDFVKDNWLSKNNLCEAKNYTLICNDGFDEYYIEAGCADGYTDTNMISSSSKYICSGSVQCNNCCDEVKCNPKFFKHCSSPTIGGGDICIEKDTKHFVDNNEYKFSECNCDTELFPYNEDNCKGAGYVLGGDKCEGDNGTYYKDCSIVCTYETKKECEHANINSICQRDSNGCYHVNSCISGYKLQNNTCVYDCEYETADNCEQHYINSICTKNDKGCFEPTACKTNYANSCDEEYTLTNTDANGCGTCVYICKYENADDCEQHYINSICTKNDKGCFEPTACKTNYANSCDELSDLTNTDDNGCGTCVDKDCSEYNDCDKYTGFVGKGESCTNSKGTFWEKCEVPEICYNVTLNNPAYYANNGFCELVVPQSNAQQYIDNGYYVVETCQPVNVEAEAFVRLHACNSTEPDCLGNYPKVYKANYDGCLNKEDGEAVICGGQTYATNCKCNEDNNYQYTSLCSVIEITDDIKQEYNKNGYAIVGNYVYLGQVKQGCENFEKQYGYAAYCSSVNYCSDNRETLFENYPYMCSSSSVCAAQSISCGDNTYCSEKCIEQGLQNSDPCKKYNNIMHTGNAFCKAYRIDTEKSFYKQVGIIPETASSDVQCAYFTYCDTKANCSKVGINETGIPDGYQSCYNIPDGANSVSCGGNTYYSSCCNSLSNCKVTTDKSRLDNALSKGYYQVNVSNVDAGCYYYASCTAAKNDCAGNPAPAKTAIAIENCKTYSPEDYFTCGGKEYVKECLAECKYDKTQTDCTALGKTFNLKCIKSGSSNEEHLELGECI